MSPREGQRICWSQGGSAQRATSESFTGMCLFLFSKVVFYDTLVYYLLPTEGSRLKVRQQDKNLLVLG